MLRLAFTLGMVYYLSTCPIFAEEIQEQLASFDYRHVGFASTAQDLLELIPTAELNNQHPGSQAGIATFEVRDDPANDCVLLRFHNEALIEIDYIYFPKRIASSGGANALTAKARKRFGKPTTTSGSTLLWDFPDVDRIVVVSYEQEKWSLHIYHRSRRLSLSDYQDATVSVKPPIKVTVGFAAPYKEKAKSGIPPDVMKAIEREAQLDHPGDISTQYYEIGNQVEAYHSLADLERSEHMPDNVFKFLKGRAARDFPNNYATQLYELRNQLSAFEQLTSMESPPGIAGSHFFAMKNSAARRHSYNYSTQLYVLNQYIDDYLQYREAGNSGEAILRYLLRFD